MWFVKSVKENTLFERSVLKKEDYPLQTAVYPLDKPMLVLGVLETHFIPMPLNYIPATYLLYNN